MTDRFNSLFVVLTKDIREDDAETLINAIKMIKGVLSVTPRVADPSDQIAYERARVEIAEKMWAVLLPRKGD